MKWKSGNVLFAEGKDGRQEHGICPAIGFASAANAAQGIWLTQKTKTRRLHDGIPDMKPISEELKIILARKRQEYWDKRTAARKKKCKILVEQKTPQGEKFRKARKAEQ